MYEDFKVSFEETIVIAEHKPPYDGNYFVTPTEETQILSTTGKVMDQDVVVQPVPKEYGRVSYIQEQKILIIK